MLVKNPTKIGETFLSTCYTRGMKAIPREARRITSSTEDRARQSNGLLSVAQRSVVVGTILGDATLAPTGSREKPGKHYRLKFDHSIKQRDYVLWKYCYLQQWFASAPRDYHKAQSIVARSISHLEFTTLRALFYRGKRKIIPERFHTFLNPLSLAVWFMDDGNKRKQYGKVYGYHLNTQSFSESENRLILSVLSEKFDIPAMMHRNHDRFRIYIGARGKDRFRSIVEPLIIPSMQYKLS
jgi:hypothetical protein